MVEVEGGTEGSCDGRGGAPVGAEGIQYSEAGIESSCDGSNCRCYSDRKLTDCVCLDNWKVKLEEEERNQNLFFKPSQSGGIVTAGNASENNLLGLM